MSEKKIIDIDLKQTIDAIFLQILNQALLKINAHSGSLMLVDRECGILQIKARLGEPRSRTTEPVFAIGDSSIAGLVAENGEPYLCFNVEKDSRFTPSRSGKYNFKSLLSVPIIDDKTVIGVINADDPKEGRFTEDEKEKLIAIAKQVSKPIAERIKSINILDSLYEVSAELTRFPTVGGIEEVLKKIAQAAVESLNVDLVTLYQYDQERDLFLVEGTGPTIAGKLNDPSPMRRKVYEGDVPWTVVKERKSGFYPNVREHDFLTGKIYRPKEKDRSRFVIRENIHSMAVLLLPFRAGKVTTDEVVGVMFANYRNYHEFTAEEQKVLATFADSAAIAIQNIRYEERKATEHVSLAHSLAASFAHRMSNMAGTIPLATQRLRQKIDPNEKSVCEKYKLLDSIESDTRMLFALAERLRRPFKESTILSSIDINKLLERILLQAKNRSKQMPSISKNFAHDLPEIHSIEPQLEEVLDNIIVNAIEAMEGKTLGELAVLTRISSTTKQIEVEITDNGPGISPEIQTRLFTPGVTTKKEKAVGIGLWLGRAFMRAIGGDVVLTKIKPTTFVVKIPVLHRADITSIT